MNIFNDSYKDGEKDGLNGTQDIVRYAADSEYKNGYDLGQGLKDGGELSKDNKKIIGNAANTITNREWVEKLGKSENYKRGYDLGEKGISSSAKSFDLPTSIILLPLFIILAIIGLDFLIVLGFVGLWIACIFTKGLRGFFGVAISGLSIWAYVVYGESSPHPWEEAMIVYLLLGLIIWLAPILALSKHPPKVLISALIFIIFLIGFFLFALNGPPSPDTNIWTTSDNLKMLKWIMVTFILGAGVIGVPILVWKLMSKKEE
jgi:hypothetical protein